MARGRCEECGRLTFQPCAWCPAARAIKTLTTAPQERRLGTCVACGETHRNARINRALSAHTLVAEVMEKAMRGEIDVHFGNRVLFAHFVYEAKAIGYYKGASNV
jgi:hypothetical protein